MTRDLCIYYARDGACLCRKRPNCPWWRDGVCGIAGKVGARKEAKGD